MPSDSKPPSLDPTGIPPSPEDTDDSDYEMDHAVEKNVDFDVVEASPPSDAPISSIGTKISDDTAQSPSSVPLGDNEEERRCLPAETCAVSSPESSDAPATSAVKEENGTTTSMVSGSPSPRGTITQTTATPTSSPDLPETKTSSKLSIPRTNEVPQGTCDVTDDAHQAHDARQDEAGSVANGEATRSTSCVAAPDLPATIASPPADEGHKVAAAEGTGSAEFPIRTKDLIEEEGRAAVATSVDPEAEGTDLPAAPDVLPTDASIASKDEEATANSAVEEADAQVTLDEAQEPLSPSHTSAEVNSAAQGPTEAAENTVRTEGRTAVLSAEPSGRHINSLSELPEIQTPKRTEEESGVPSPSTALSHTDDERRPQDQENSNLATVTETVTLTAAPPSASWLTHTATGGSSDSLNLRNVPSPPQEQQQRPVILQQQHAPLTPVPASPSPQRALAAFSTPQSQPAAYHAASFLTSPVQPPQFEQSAQQRAPILRAMSSMAAGRHSIKLRLVEEAAEKEEEKKPSSTSFFFRRGRRARSVSHPAGTLFDESPLNVRSLSGHSDETHDSATRTGMRQVEHGFVTVSWYEGTTSSELQEHVRNSVIRKLGLKGSIKLDDLRIIDESVEPHEEIVLCPFIPDGSQFLLKFTTKDTTPAPQHRTLDRVDSFVPVAPPDSPSAAPMRPSTVDLAALNAAQLQLLGASLLQLKGPITPDTLSQSIHGATSEPLPPLPAMDGSSKGSTTDGSDSSSSAVVEKDASGPENRATKDSADASRSREEKQPLSSDEFFEKLEDFLHQKRGKHVRSRDRYRQEKKQVIFVIANYLVLFLGLIAISAEIQERLPNWMEWVEHKVDRVQDCAADRDSLYECVSNGDFTGLIASVLLWVTQSATTKQIFLFGFDSPKKLWTVVYEAFVTAICWGTSYTFIRRGLNPDTRQNFLQKYWKDAVYGSLAGFNAAFMKAVLKNLIPQDVALEALENRQLKIVNWFTDLIGVPVAY